MTLDIIKTYDVNLKNDFIIEIYFYWMNSNSIQFFSINRNHYQIEIKRSC